MKLFLIITITFLFANCKSNNYLHKDVNSNNIPSIIEFSNTSGMHDTMWLNPKTACVKLSAYHLKIGKIKKGKEVGKWYYYYVVGDTIDCYKINIYRKKDTINNIIKLINPKYF